MKRIEETSHGEPMPKKNSPGPGSFVTEVALAARIGIKSLVKPGKTRILPQSLKGAILGIGLSIVPLLVVIVISNGMIDGITQRLIEISTYHLQVTFFEKPTQKLLRETKDDLAKQKGVKFIFPERDGFVQLRFGRNITGTALRCTSPELFTEDEGFKRYFDLLEGERTLTTVPRSIRKDVFEGKILAALAEKERSIVSDVYAEDFVTGMYLLNSDIGVDIRSEVEAAFATIGVTTILLGKTLSENLKAKPGDMVYILSFTEFRSRMIPKSGKAIVTGIFSTGYQFIDKLLAYMPYKTGIELVPQNRTSSKDILGIKVEDPFGDIGAISDSINIRLGNTGVGASAESWYDLQRNQYRSFELTKTLLVFIMILIVIVAAANVFSSIVMIVMDRTQEIAILKSMGARPFTISLSFLFTGFYTGAIGAFIGIVVGLLVAVNINEVFKIVDLLINGTIWIFDKVIAPFYTIEKKADFVILNPQFYLEKIPIKISITELLFVAFITISLSVLSAVIPARNAGNIRPIEIIRKY